MAQIRSKQIQDFLTTVNWGTVTNKQIANAFDVDARFDLAEGSIDSLESLVAAGTSDLVNSVDSLELALSAEIVARGLDVDAEESRALVAEGSLDTKVSMETARAIDAEGSLDTKISNEVSSERLRAQNAEVSLDTRISAEVVRAENAEDSLDTAIGNEVSRATAAEGVINNSIDSLEGDVSSIDTRLGSVSGNLVDSVDSLELALSAEIVARGLDVDAEESRAIAAEDALSLELSMEIYDARLYTSDEMLRAQTEEGILAESIDSLELALAGDFSSIDARVSAEHVEHASVEAVLDGKISTEKGRIDAILLAADADKDTFAEIVSLINAVDTTNDDAFAGYVLSNNASVDSIELALSAEIAATNDDVTAINSSIDSLELALSAEIVATNDDIVAINDSIDSLETALAGATTYVEQVVTGVTSGKTFSITTPVLFAADKDLEVFVNGLKVPFTTFNGITFNIVADYDLEGTDKVTVLGIEA